MNDGTRFLIVSLGGDLYALPITRLQEIAVPRNIEKDAKLTELFEGKFDYRGASIPVLNMKKIFRIPGPPGASLLVIKSDKGLIGLLVDAVTEILATEQRPAPLPPGVLNPEHRYYGGVLHHKAGLVLLLNEDGLLP
jgi:chemotaxis signal transduction protein